MLAVVTDAHFVPARPGTPQPTDPVVLTGADLTIADVEAVARHGVRAALDLHARRRLRANTLALGHSGCRPELVDFLLRLLELGIHPVVPEQGSVGASGDLAPLAHLALPVIGRGKVEVAGQVIPALVALREHGLEP